MEEQIPPEMRNPENLYQPFENRAEWDLGKFLCENLTQSQIDRFLKLDFIRNLNSPPSFKNKDRLLSMMDQLPSGPSWKITKFEVTGYTTTHPINLIWRDGLEVVKQLFSNPIYAQHMSYDPVLVYNGTQREFGEFFTSQRAFNLQSQLPEGATIVPIIAASDKTPVTRHTGGLEMHPLFLTIGNINSDVRMKATAHAWSCVAFMPIPKFDTHGDYQSILSARVWHKCMDIVCDRLKVAAQVGEFMVDPLSHLRYCFTFLVAYVDPWDLDRFQKKAKELHMNGVHQPFWRNWTGADPALFLVGEILHTLHKFFFDHPLKWCKDIVGNDELNARYKSHHKRIGTRHFASGVTHAKQMTGRDHRDIQRTIVPSIAGAAPPDVVLTIRHLVDFIYQAQAPVHTEATIKAMVQSLNGFHNAKEAILKANARQNFHIPKLELFQSFGGMIRNVGSLHQYSADVSERLLITHCKHPFERTSRQQSMRCFDLFALLLSKGVALTNAIAMEDEEVKSTDPTLAWIARVLPDDQRRFTGPRPVRNHFLKGILSDDANTAFHVTVAPDEKALSIAALEKLYQIPDIGQELCQYILECTESAPDGSSLWSHENRQFSAWHKFRLQLHSSFREHVIMPSQVVQAVPPSPSRPGGICDTVIVDSNRNSEDSSIPSICVAQVRAVFQPKVRPNEQLPPFLAQPLLYVQYFQWAARPEDDPSVGMWMVERVYRQGPWGDQRHGAVIPMTDVTHTAELIPVYGERLDRRVTMENSMEAFRYYYLNNYSDKEIFHTLQTEFS
ncbi:hypothetical protein BJ138DRAFT_1200335 [Hygrophoropsis aurantiaca]|uniref:Uncharacterized protein n=1 Tax=Hygrophoropsis aurantiaca TaxID=72124 RepID=A0ACB8A7X5_9AGAM|nr:hypothetical protein BJ138DRAFT_1200335 [Hygrophoropsis aurantiaca]